MSERDVTPQRPAGSFNPRTVLILGVLVVLAITVFTSVYIVDQRETAVLLRFGRFLRTEDEGLHFKFPFGIDQNINVETEVVKTEEFGYRTERAGVQSVFSAEDFPNESIMLTGDLNIVDAEWSIQYRIARPRDYLFKVEDQIKTIRDISQSVMNQLIGDRSVIDVISSERENVEFLGRGLMNEFYDTFQLGIRVTAVKFRDVVPPKGAVQSAFEDVNKAIQDRSRFIEEGKEAFNQAIPLARGQAQQIIQEADGYKAERVNRASGDVARFISVYDEYRRAPAVTRSRLYYEMFEDVFRDADGTDLIDRNLDNFIPLKNLVPSFQAPRKGCVY
jgi:membrane protease subunit HflK